MSKYSREDISKKKQDMLADLRAKGVDAREIYAVHPKGELAVLKDMLRDIGCTRDQSQEQIERNRRGKSG